MAYTQAVRAINRDPLDYVAQQHERLWRKSLVRLLEVRHSTIW
ncbi:hypothetical protein [Caballeronia pedi]|nr:hypothetical protein [Caballeronia pedi]